MSIYVHQGNEPAHDVVICGGGLAGATLARQLKLTHPDVTILVLDAQTYPLPAAAHKVGESTVEIAGFYFAESLRLRAYMDTYHLPKLGLRYFWNSFEEKFSSRPEVGLSVYPPRQSYQIDRGVLENDLYQMNREAGVDVRQGTRVLDIHLQEDRAWHEISYLDRDDVQQRVRGRWVVDAMGRRRYLRNKLGLQKEIPERFNAVWFRIKGRLDVEDFVPDEEGPWHERVPGRQRYHSTNHLMGKGYWIWLIPLGSGNTSVGIVTDEKFHDLSEMDSLGKSLDWLAKHDPIMHSRMRGREFMDFMSARNYNYSTKQIFSSARWACIGEAAAFSDPFYSPGSNMIAFENTCLTHMIGEDRAGGLSEERVKFFNEFVISQNDWLDYNIHTAYKYFGDPMVMSLAFLWDTVVAWGIATPQMFNSIYLAPETSAAVRAASSRFYDLALQTKNLFIQWGKRSQGSFTFDFIDYYNIPFIQEIYRRCLVENKSREELVDDHRFVMNRMEEFAQVIFLMAVQDTMPAGMGMLREARWLNAWATGLDAERWAQDGLFRPHTEPRSLEPIITQVRGLYRPASAAGQRAQRTFHIDLEL